MNGAGGRRVAGAGMGGDTTTYVLGGNPFDEVASLI
jgi:hypothetical protein